MTKTAWVLNEANNVFEEMYVACVHCGNSTLTDEAVEPIRGTCTSCNQRLIHPVIIGEQLFDLHEQPLKGFKTKPLRNKK